MTPQLQERGYMEDAPSQVQQQQQPQQQQPSPMDGPSHSNPNPAPSPNGQANSIGGGNTTIQLLSMGSSGSGGGNSYAGRSSQIMTDSSYDDISNAAAAVKQFYPPTVTQAQALVNQSRADGGYQMPNHHPRDGYPEYPFNRGAAANMGAGAGPHSAPGAGGVNPDPMLSSQSPHRNRSFPPPPPPPPTTNPNSADRPMKTEEPQYLHHPTPPVVSSSSSEMQMDPAYPPNRYPRHPPHHQPPYHAPRFHPREEYNPYGPPPGQFGRMGHPMPPHHRHHHPGPPPYYDSMDMDHTMKMEPTGYDDGRNHYYNQYEHPPHHHPMGPGGPPPNFMHGQHHPMDTDPNMHHPSQRRNPHYPRQIHVSPSPPMEESQISPSMSNATATTAASSSNNSFGTQDGSGRQAPPRTSLGGGGVTRAMSDRKQMQSQAWYDRFRELTKYKEVHGNCMVPQKYEPNPSLGIWVNKQRMEYKLLQDGEKSSMTTERLTALQSIGFVWAKRKGQATWDAKYKQLQEYKANNGDCLIPTKYAKDPALGRWVSTQREQYRLWKAGDERSKMTVEKVRLLEEVGFVWRLQF